MKKLYIVLALALVSGLLWWVFMPAKVISPVGAKPTSCMKENAECNVNNSGKLCCDGLVCMDKGVPSNNGKCQLNPSPSPSPFPSVSPSPSMSPSPSPETKIWCYRIDEKKDECKEEEVKKCKKDWEEGRCPSDEPETSPEPNPEPIIMRDTSLVEHGPAGCGESAIVNSVANFHLYRKGPDAILRWVPTEGNKVNIYWKQVNSSDWQYAITGLSNNSMAEIHDLGSLDITFAIQQAGDCAAGPLSYPIVDGETSGWVLFR